jgi:HK97 family phage major capsid protein
MPDGERLGADVVRRDCWQIVITKADDEKRVIEGIATTPRVDRMGDIVEPMGAEFLPQVPLKWMHERGVPNIGHVRFNRPTKSGIPFVAQIIKYTQPGQLKDMLDLAWDSVKARAVEFVSIGFTPLRAKNAVEQMDNGGLRFNKYEIVELSLVDIPANQDAKIEFVRSLAQKSFSVAASGPPPPGASGKPNEPPPGGFFSSRGKGTTMQGIAERLSEREGQRVEKSARMQELTTKCDGDFNTLTADEQREFDGLNAEVEQLDRDIARYRGSLRAANQAKAIPTSAGTDPETAFRVRSGDFKPTHNLPKGTLWTRATIMKARAIKMHMSLSDAADWAKKEWPDTPEVAIYIKANPGTGASGNWAEPLNAVNTVDNDFIALLRPATIIGKLPLRPSPFNVKMIRQTGGSTVGWVGKAAAKPVSELAYDTVQVDQSKVAGIIVLTDDQIMTSHIDSVEATRMDLVAQIAQFADEQFTDPSVAAVSGTNPASVTNGVTAVASGGATADDLRADLHKLLNRFTAASIPLSGIYFVMSSFVASGASMLTNSLGQPDFPDLTVEGGRLRGFPVIVSDSVGGSSSSSNLIAVKASEVLLAQNGGVRVDMSRDATIDMAGGNSPTFSLFQKNAVALRAEWWVSWQKARAEAVQYISGANYAPANP